MITSTTHFMTGQQFYELISTTPGNSTQKCLAALEAFGFASTRTQSKALGLSMRGVEKAKKGMSNRTSGREHPSMPEQKFASTSSLMNFAEQKSELTFANQITETRACANTESPSEINTSIKVLGDREVLNLVEREIPRLTERGFLVSEKHKIVIALSVYEGWKTRFPAIRDLEATVTGLAAHIVAKGHSHVGWQCPEGWMMKLLADENTKAVNLAREAKHRDDRASGFGRPTWEEQKALRHEATREILRKLSNRGEGSR